MNDFQIACCVYCYMGCEDQFARLSTGAAVIVPYRIRRDKEQGKWVDKKIKLIPGYAFIYADSMEEVLNTMRGFRVKLLTYSDDDSVLRGSDLDFARWVWNNDGVIGISSAIHEQDKVKIISGALKENEGMIVQLDRRHKLAKVALNIGLKVWLSYDWLDNMEAN